MEHKSSHEQDQGAPVSSSGCEPLRELTFGQSRSSIDVSQRGGEAKAAKSRQPSEVESLAARCRAEAARWAVERQRRIHKWDQGPDEEAPDDSAIVKWAESLTLLAKGPSRSVCNVARPLPHH